MSGDGADCFNGRRGVPTAYVKAFLTAAVTLRRLKGATPKIDLSLGYRKTNASPVLQMFLTKADRLAKTDAG